jgi:radical SAM superfamily enzyme YgiQ (UPF0313 family)
VRRVIPALAAAPRRRPAARGVMAPRAVPDIGRRTPALLGGHHRDLPVTLGSHQFAMRALLVQAKSPPTYWGYQYSLPIAGRLAPIPPLGLATLAALLPQSWELRVHDLHVGPLTDDLLEWSDVVLVSCMLIQADSAREVLRRARALGRRTVVGGPAVSTSPETFVEADHLFLGEAEDRLELLVAALEEPGRDVPRVLSPPGDERPDVRRTPVPRFDLLSLGSYATMSLQISRGCPFNCEFCDIIEIFGRVPRVKTVEQVIAEMEALLALGAHGPLFFVDDNFIGNRRAIARMLPVITAWQREHGYPFEICTEASIDLATEPALLSAMVEAGFDSVFVGIESPSKDSLAGAHKNQNLRMDQAEAVNVLTRAGLEVFAGFIVGFDTDDADIFDRQLEFISGLAIPRAMVGILSALPDTALWRRLEKEGRLRCTPSGDQFERTNFVTAMDEYELVAGYRRLLAALYTDEAYYQRCEQHFERATFQRFALKDGSMAGFLRSVWTIGIRGRRRRYYWRLLARSLRRGFVAFPKAVVLAVVGEHMVRYTEEVVLPRLDAALAQIAAERQREGRAVPQPMGRQPQPDLVPAPLIVAPPDAAEASV